MVEIVKTRTQLIERAAVELGALPSGQELSDEDSDTIENLVDPLVQQLAIEDVVTIEDTDQIPSEYFIPLARLLANESAPSFGQAYSADVRAVNASVLRRLSAARGTGEVLKATYF